MVRSVVARRPTILIELEDAAMMLGVEPDASEAEVRAAFRTAARNAHPDNGGNGHADLGRLVAARDTLLDALERSRAPWLD